MWKLVLVGTGVFAAGAVTVPWLIVWLISREPFDHSVWTDD